MSSVKFTLATEDKLWVFFWDSGYHNGPIVELWPESQIAETSSLETDVKQEILALDVDETLAKYGVCDTFKVWRAQ